VTNFSEKWLLLPTNNLCRPFSTDKVTFFLNRCSNSTSAWLCCTLENSDRRNEFGAHALFLEFQKWNTNLTG